MGATDEAQSSSNSVTRNSLSTELMAPLPHGSQCSSGWKMVPVEPTPSMIRAAHKCAPPESRKWHAAIKEKYAAMIAAAPTAPALPVEPVQYGWISVSDRFPNRGETVLTYADSGLTQIRKFGKFTFPTHMHVVTHWMPLPQIPVQNEGEPWIG